MRIILYLHSSKEYAYDEAQKAGLTGEALKMAKYLGYEHEMEYEVNEQTGEGTLIAVDKQKLGGNQ